MKKLQQLLTVIAFVAITSFISSCGSNDSPDTDDILTAKIDGENYATSGDEVTATLTENGVFNLTSIDSSTGKTIIITVKPFNGVNTYDLTIVNSEAINGGVYNINNNQAYTSAAEGGEGELVITDYDAVNNLVSGTFHYTALRSVDDNGVVLDEPEKVVITEGVFTNVNIGNGDQGLESGDFVATIDGTETSFDSVSAVVVSNKISINATNTSLNKNIGIFLPETIEPGTYALGSVLSLADYAAQYTPDTNVSGTSGVYAADIDTSSITIISHDQTAKHIEGTFYFNAIVSSELTYAITNGSFSLDYN